MNRLLIHTVDDPDFLPRTLVEFGPFSVEFYAFFIVLGILAALGLGLLEGPKIGLKRDYIVDGLIIILPFAVLGTRLWYVIFEWERYAGDIGAMFRFWDGGLAIHGGIVTAIVASYIYTKVRGMDIWKTLDLVAPGFLVAQAFGRWGNFFNQEAHGGVIGGMENGDAALSLDEQREFLSGTLRLPEFIVNNMYIPDGVEGAFYYHPTFLYESLWNLVGLGVVLILRRTPFIRSGDLIAVYLIWYSIGRFFIEFMRTDALFIGDTGLRAAQVTSVALVLLGAAVLIMNRTIFKRPRYRSVLEENAES